MIFLENEAHILGESMKKISVIVPCYNASPYLADLMESLLGQTIGRDAMEIICVNDASTDNTYEVLMSFEEKYSDTIMVINLAENMRQGTARNIALSYASGAYVAFIDADDVIEQDMFEKLLEPAERENLDMAGGIVLHHVNGQRIRMPNHLKTGEVVEVTGPRDRMDLILHGNCGGIVSKIYRREMLLENALLFPERTYYEDNYWLPMVNLYIGRYYIVDEIVYHYIDRPASTVNKKNEQAMQDRLNMEVQKLHAYIQRGFFKEYYPGIEAVFCRSYYIDTLLSIYALWGEVPMHFYEAMKREMCSLFPRCRENTILLEKDRKFLDTAFCDLTQKQLHEKILSYAAAS